MSLAVAVPYVEPMVRRLPTPVWTVGYQRGWLRGDVIAGVTITAYLIPQVMAYAELAGLPAVVGLWASVGALLAYAVLGSSNQLSVGPESTTALMTAAAIGALASVGSDEYADLAAALCLVVSGLCLLGWFGRLAFLAELLSRPVLVGYMSGVAGIMIVSQLGKLTGIDVAASGVLPELRYVAGHLSDVHTPTLTLGLVTLVVMLAGSFLAPRAPMALIGMVGAAAAVSLLDLSERGVTVIGTIPFGLPVPSLPNVSFDGVVALIPAALGVAFVGYTDNILTGRAFANRSGERIDAKRELLALGAANLASGVMHGFPVSSSGSRTAIGKAAGGRTQLTGLITVATTVLAVLSLRPLLASFPTAALGAVVVYAAVRLIDIAEFRRLAGFRRTEFADRARHRCRRPGGRGPPRRAGGHRALSARPPGSRRPATRRHPGIRARPRRDARRRRLPGGHSYPGLDRIPLRLPPVLRQHRGLPPQSLGLRCHGNRAGAVVRAQRRGDHRHRHHRSGRARGRAQGTLQPAASSSPWRA